VDVHIAFIQNTTYDTCPCTARSCIWIYMYFSFRLAHPLTPTVQFSDPYMDLLSAEAIGIQYVFQELS